MAPVTSLYRRHRPQSFGEVVGQEHVVRTLSNAIERDRVHHAYLFVGSRGTGKTSLAKILARSLNCVRGPTLEPCGECESCTTIAAGSSLDVIEMDAASNRSVDDIRELRDRVGFAPAAGRWKVYILDEAHMLTREAWNAFLKTLEEPPPSTVFVLATTEPHKVMATIVDRCQRFDFQRPAPEQIAEVLRRVAAAEQIELADGAIAAVARSATGSFRDALGTLDQLVAYGGKRIETDDVLAVLGVADAELILAAAEALAAGDAKATFAVSERLARSGRDVAQFGRDLLAHLRALLVIRAAGEPVGDAGLAAAEPERMQVQADSFTDLGIGRSIDAVAKALADIREGDEPRMTLELALLRAARPQFDVSREAFAQRLEALERGGTSSRAAQERATPESPHPETGDEKAAPEADSREGEGLDLEKLVGMWPAVMEQLRSGGSELLAHALEVARPVAVNVEQAVLEVGFPAGAAFNRRKADAPDARKRFTEAVRTIVGEGLRPVYVLLEGEDAAAGEPKALDEEELIEKLKAEFDAEEFEVENDTGDETKTGEAA